MSSIAKYSDESLIAYSEEKINILLSRKRDNQVADMKSVQKSQSRTVESTVEIVARKTGKRCGRPIGKINSYAGPITQL